MFAGLMMTRLLKKSRLPDVTAYLVAGVLIGPCVIGALHIPGIGFSSYEALESVGLISKVALGFIAFSIGNEFRMSQLKETETGLCHRYTAGCGRHAACGYCPADLPLYPA